MWRLTTSKGPAGYRELGRATLAFCDAKGAGLAPKRTIRRSLGARRGNLTMRRSSVRQRRRYHPAAAQEESAPNVTMRTTPSEPYKARVEGGTAWSAHPAAGPASFGSDTRGAAAISMRADVARAAGGQPGVGPGDRRVGWAGPLESATGGPDRDRLGRTSRDSTNVLLRRSHDAASSDCETQPIQ